MLSSEISAAVMCTIAFHPYYGLRSYYEYFSRFKDFVRPVQAVIVALL